MALYMLVYGRLDPLQNVILERLRSIIGASIINPLRQHILWVND